MKGKWKLLLLLGVALLCRAAQPSGDTPQERYIARYSAMAVSEMYRTGVPASITLAQGLLESRYGQSALAVQGNNHFGIKCHDWKGKTMRQDDDKRNECFRVYDNAEESFKDHSDFLRYRDRYKFLFDYKVTDYKSWAYGLKKAGYATDPAYPDKLIKLIEDYNLSAYDKMSVKQAEKTLEPSARKAKVFIDDTQTEIPTSPLQLEEATKYTPNSRESFRYSLSRQMYSKNGVPFIYTSEGETFESIARANDLFVKELLKFNDLSMVEKLDPGTLVYLKAKKKQSVKGLDKYIVDHDGESLWEISQRFGVKLESLEKMNSLTRNADLREGDTILLRKPSKGGFLGLFKKKA